MSEKEDALQRIVTLALANSLSAKEISRAIREHGGESASSLVLTRLFAYLGAVFVFSGIAAFFAMFWDEMATPARIISTLGIGFAIYLFALISNFTNSQNKVAAPLFLVAAFLETSGLFVTIDELGWAWEMQDRSLWIFGVMLLQFAVTFLVVQRTSILFNALTFYFLFAGTVLDKLGFDGELISFAVGTSVLCINYLVDNSDHKSIAGFWYLLASIACLGGAFKLLEDMNLDVLFIGLSCLFMYASTALHSRALLFTSCTALLSYIAYFTAENFVDSLGWPIALICLGFVFIGISSLALRINKSYLA